MLQHVMSKSTYAEHESLQAKGTLFALSSSWDAVVDDAIAFVVVVGTNKISHAIWTPPLLSRERLAAPTYPIIIPVKFPSAMENFKWKSGKKLNPTFLKSLIEFRNFLGRTYIHIAILLNVSTTFFAQSCTRHMTRKVRKAFFAQVVFARSLLALTLGFREKFRCY